MLIGNSSGMVGTVVPVTRTVPVPVLVLVQLLRPPWKCHHKRWLRVVRRVWSRIGRRTPSPQIRTRVVRRRYRVRSIRCSRTILRLPRPSPGWPRWVMFRRPRRSILPPRPRRITSKSRWGSPGRILIWRTTSMIQCSRISRQDWIRGSVRPWSLRSWVEVVMRVRLRSRRRRARPPSLWWRWRTELW